MKIIIWVWGVEQVENTIDNTIWLRCFFKKKASEYLCIIIHDLSSLPHFNISYICKYVYKQIIFFKMQSQSFYDLVEFLFC